MRDDTWRDRDFYGYDGIVHAAGLVHQPRTRAEEYGRVNRDLTLAVAGKGKDEGVKQFILMSTMAVYGRESELGRINEIGGDTSVRPRSLYGKSKYEAEIGALQLENEDFSVCIIRAPMVYGPGCPGNYGSLRRIALSFGLAPALENRRSAVFIGNLCEYIRLLIAGEERGLFCPRDNEDLCTASVMDWIAGEQGRVLRRSKLLGAAIRCLAPVLPAAGKAFGNLTYAPGLSVIPADTYCLWDLREAIKVTETAWDAPSPFEAILDNRAIR